MLDGLEATTHWLELETLDKLGARSTSKRVVEQGKVITAAGVSSGIDMALLLASRIAGDDFAQGIQLLIEYDPQPPFDAGSPAKAPPEMVELIETMAQPAHGAAGRERGAGLDRRLDLVQHHAEVELLVRHLGEQLVGVEALALAPDRAQQVAGLGCA